jgi:hypothetical protein
VGEWASLIFSSSVPSAGGEGSPYTKPAEGEGDLSLRVGPNAHPVTDRGDQMAMKTLVRMLLIMAIAGLILSILLLIALAGGWGC